MRARTVVIALAVAGISAGAAMPAFDHGHVHAPASAPAGLVAASAAGAFSALGGRRLVPANVLGALPVPAGAAVTGRANGDKGSGQFDRTVRFRAKVGYQGLASFFPAELRRHGWTLLADTRPFKGSGREILATHPGSDGYYWEAGVVISPPSGPGSTFSLELFQRPDPG